jgi:hypothetical protein
VTRPIMLLAAIVAAVLVAAPTAGAATVKLAGGATTVALDKGVAGALTEAGVKVGVTKPGKAGTKGIAFPIRGGAIDPATGAGRIDHRGGLTFKAQGKTVGLSAFVVKVGKRSTLSAKVGKGRLTVFSLDTSKVKVKRNGIGTTLSGVRLKLTGKAAAALNGAFGVKLFAKGLNVGKANVNATPAQVLLDGGSTALALDPGAAAALTSLGIQASLVDPATAAADGFNFPITGGKLDAKSFAGSVAHSGGIRLTKGGTNVELTNFTINVDDAPDLTALVGGQRVSILSLDLAGLSVQAKGRAITLGGVKASLTKVAADALNAAFGTAAFSEGLVIGTAAVKAQLR